MGRKSPWTKNYLANQTINITHEMSLTSLRIICKTAPITILGSSPAGSIACDAITLAVGNIVDIGSKNSNVILDGIRISGAGTASIIGE